MCLQIHALIKPYLDAWQSMIESPCGLLLQNYSLIFVPVEEDFIFYC
jgi:hypothetical protein